MSFPEFTRRSSSRRRVPLALFALALLCGGAMHRATAQEPPPGAAVGPEWKLERPATAPLNPVGGFWQHRVYGESIQLTLIAPDATGGPWTLPASLPNGGEFFITPEHAPGDWDLLHIDLTMPDDFPAAALIYVWVKDWDSNWSQVRCDLPPPAPGTTPGSAVAAERTLTVPLTGPAAERAWQASGHHRPWNQRAPWQITEIGLKVASPADQPLTWNGTLKVRGLRLSRLAPADVPAPVVRNIRRSADRLKVGQPFELSFETTHPFRDPFDGQEVALGATVTAPDGTTQRLRAFYFEDFLYDYQAREAVPVPFAHPQFRVRFTPTQPGEYRVQVDGRIRSAAVTLPATTFLADADPEWRGFVRKSTKDWRYLAWSETGKEFEGVPINMRSPYDTRYVAEFPFSDWKETDLRVYKTLFPKYRAAGINVVEVWMSSWWLALEWIPDAPGFHGVGYYNQYRAWKLDQLFQWAAENDLYLILVFNNHGKFSNWCDQEWARNPYNKANGGWLGSPQEYFTEARSRAAAQRLIDYLAARWGYSDHLLAWKLFTEIDLTGENIEWYKTQAVADWHQDMGTYLKQQDPNRHLVTTHWSTSYQRVTDLLAKQPALDFLTLDIYYSGKGASRLWNFMEQTISFMERMQKPCLITEFGGSPWADSLDHMRNQLHLGLWSGWFGGMVLSPGFWWFQLVEEQNLYHEYRAVRNFIDGEARADAKRLRSVIPDTRLNAMELRSNGRRLYWIFDSDYYFAGDLRRAAKPQVDVKLPFYDLEPGQYAVEIWDCTTGERLETRELSVVRGTPASLTLPTFEKDISVKLRRLDAEAAAAKK